MSAATQEATKWVGQGILRKEDPELVTGQARYVDDLTLPGMVWMSVVRSPHAHARITKVDLSAALSKPGVVAAFSGEDLASEFAAGLPCAWPIPTTHWPEPFDSDPKLPTHWPLARDKARFAGDGVAVVIADSREHAVDAAETVVVDYDVLDPVLDLETAAGGPAVHDEIPDNKTYTWSLSGGNQDVFLEAPVLVHERYVHPRLVPNAIEPRGVLVQPVAAQGEFTIWSATQIPHILRTTLALTLGIPESKLRVIAPDVGGGFGSKLNVYAEEVLCLAVARRLGTPVKWIEDR
ncbi:MAG TPA: molybdopterin cofactor-binding domain-containing protein, partial [Gaiellaceae bacterium]|nr:molybdopterin cofactor-binding domain-containing protein [Gaiellaceae bacterium]